MFYYSLPSMTPLMLSNILGGPLKMERHPQYVDAITGISVWGKFSWKKLYQECALIKFIGLLLTTMASWNDIHSALVEAEKGKKLGLDLVSQMCTRKQTTAPNLLILVSFFSGEVTSYTDTSYCIHKLWEACCSVFFWPPCIWLVSINVNQLLQVMALSLNYISFWIQWLYLWWDWKKKFIAKISSFLPFSPNFVCSTSQKTAGFAFKGIV